MQRLAYFMMFVTMAVMGQESYNVWDKCNKSIEYTNSQHPSSPYSPYIRRLLARDNSYLPEEDYIDEHEKLQERSHNRDNRNLLPEYRSLCEIVTRKVRLDDSEYEYQPPHYHEVYCKNYSVLDRLQRAVNSPKQLCVQPSFHCVQRSKSMFLLRRRWESECWEPFVKQIASGCDCMWPVSVLGDITDHY